MRAGSRPLNQRRCLEGAPIKQILKECFIHNASLCYFVPGSGVIDFLQVISLRRLVHYTVLFVVLLCDALWWFEILLNPAVKLAEPFVLLLFHRCDMWPRALYRWISVMSACVTPREGQDQPPILRADRVKLFQINCSIIYTCIAFKTCIC